MKFKPHSRFALPFCIFPMLTAGVYRNFPKQNTRYSYIFPKICIERQLSSMVKSASIVRNLSKNHTFRTIASILIDTQSRFPANFNWAKPTFPRNLICAIPPFSVNLAEFYNINSVIAGVKNHPCRV